MSSTSVSKRQHGQYFTLRNPFNHPEFDAWARRAGLPEETLIEPFAGANNIVRMLQDKDLCRCFVSYDIEPAADEVVRRDVFKSYPEDKGVVVTNPPYMAKNSAKRRGLSFPDTAFADLYLYSLDLMLQNTDYVAAIVPAAIGTTRHFRDRLTHVISLPFSDMFGDTDHPVCLALFEPKSDVVKFWSWTTYLGSEDAIRSAIPDLPSPVRVVFNDPQGILGLRAVDGTSGPSIRFCRGEEIASSEIKHSSRSITRMSVDGLDEANLDAVISHANSHLEKIRNITMDVTLTPFKGIRKDGSFRRRLDFKTAKIILSIVMREM
jgi:hypothetical protein